MSTLFQNPGRFQSVLENLPLGVYVVDREFQVSFWNRGAERITGQLAHETVGHSYKGRVLQCDKDGRALFGEHCPIQATFRDASPQHVFAFVMHKQGHRVGVKIETVPIFDDQEVLIGVTVLLHEASATQKEPFDSAVYGCLDSLTGIPSERLTRAVLGECLHSLEQSHGAFGVLWIRLLQLDDFRSRHGADSVNGFLRSSALTLRHSLDVSSFLGRWGANEFVVVLDSSSSMTVAVRAETIWRLLSQSGFSWWGDYFLVAAVVAHEVVSQGMQIEDLVQRMSASIAEQLKNIEHGTAPKAARG